MKWKHQHKTLNHTTDTRDNTKWIIDTKNYKDAKMRSTTFSNGWLQDNWCKLQHYLLGWWCFWLSECSSWIETPRSKSVRLIYSIDKFVYVLNDWVDFTCWCLGFTRRLDWTLDDFFDGLWSLFLDEKHWLKLEIERARLLRARLMKPNRYTACWICMCQLQPRHSSLIGTHQI